MNQDLKSFLLAHNVSAIGETSVTFPDGDHESDQQLFPLVHLACLSVSGIDAATFLQGQITGNVNELNENRSMFTALCNPKGRVISTFLLIKTNESYLMVLPKELLETVKNLLTRYVLRSKVIIQSLIELCLTGIYNREFSADTLFATSHKDTITVSIGCCHIIIADSEKTLELWNHMIEMGFVFGSTENWIYQDIVSGIPWLCLKTSEQFIPQMLNLDKLGGISFNKGCYTGQEVVARTHYLGKAKRAMFLAESNQNHNGEPLDSVFDDSTGILQTVGNVLLAQKNKLLIVLQLSETGVYSLKLKNGQQLVLSNLDIQ